MRITLREWRMFVQEEDEIGDHKLTVILMELWFLLFKDKRQLVIYKNRFFWFWNWNFRKKEICVLYLSSLVCLSCPRIYVTLKSSFHFVFNWLLFPRVLEWFRIVQNLSTFLFLFHFYLKSVFVVTWYW